MAKKAWKPMVESLIMTTGFVLANLSLFPEQPALVSWVPHPIVAIALLAVVRWGFWGGLQAAMISAAAYAVLLLGMADVPTVFHLLETPYSTPVVILIPVTVLLGMLVQRHIDRRDDSQNKLRALERRNSDLEAEHAQLRDVNIELARKIVGAKATLQTLYRHAKDMNALEATRIYAGATRMLVEVLGADAVSAWTLEPTGDLQLAAREGEAGSLARLVLSPQLEKRLERDGVVLNRDLADEVRRPDLPEILARLTEGEEGRAIGYLAVERLPFARLNREAVRLSTMVAAWVSDSVGKARAFEALSAGPSAPRFPDRPEASGPTSPWTPARVKAAPGSFEGRLASVRVQSIPLQPSNRLGSFVLAQQIARGRRGSVWVAYEGARTVALKILDQPLAGPEAAAEEQRIEANALLGVDHPNIVRMLGFHTAGGHHFTSMEFVDGVDLGTILCQLRQRSECLPVPLALYVAREVADALGYAHWRGTATDNDEEFVHGRLSPKNIMLTRDGQVKILEFGVMPAGGRSAAGVSAEDWSAYQAPERAGGTGATHAADVFALGVVMWEMLTMRGLFSASRGAPPAGSADAGRVPLVRSVNSAVPALADRLLQRMLAEHASSRPSNMAIVAKELGRILRAEYAVAKASKEALAECTAPFILSNGVRHAALRSIQTDVA